MMRKETCQNPSEETTAKAEGIWRIRFLVVLAMLVTAGFMNTHFIGFCLSACESIAAFLDDSVILVLRYLAELMESHVPPA